MISPAPAPAAGNNSSSSSTAAPASYTTIPISGADVLSRSVQNLSTSLSRCRPWPEFLSAGAIELPSSLSAALPRLRVNSRYFYVNYAIVTSACAAASLIGTPVSLIVVAFLFALWLVLFFCREDPMVVMGRHEDDRAVTAGLVLVSVGVIWALGGAILTNLLIGISVGLLITVSHGLLRKTEGLYLDENDSVSNGLMSVSQNGEIY